VENEVMVRRVETSARLAAAVAIAVAVPLAPSGRAAEPTDGPLLAAIGISTNRDAQKAAEQAARSMLAKFRSRGRRPAVAIFLERSGTRPAEEGKAIGDRVKELLKVPTYGSGGAIGTVGVTWWAKRDHEPTLQVLGLAGGGVKVRAYLAGGALPNDRRAAEARGRALGRLVVPMGGGLALFLGGGGEVGGAYLAALRDAMRPDAPLLGAIGKAGDYVYADGQTLKDPNGTPAAVGQLILTIEGESKVVAAGAASRNVGDGQAVLEEADAVARHAADALGQRTVRLVLAFSGTARLRTSGLDRPGTELGRLRAIFGRDVPVFGCFSPLQAGVDNQGRFSVGPGRLMLVALTDP
jgi:hypothetical protein